LKHCIGIELFFQTDSSERVRRRGTFFSLCVCACVRACVRVCVHACAGMCACACV
jgi:hypothetical protein